MAIPAKKTLVNGVNLALLEPVETLNPDQLKKYNKEELGAYLMFYGTPLFIHPWNRYKGK